MPAARLAHLLQGYSDLAMVLDSDQNIRYMIGMEKTITFKTPTTIRELRNLICEIVPYADLQEDNNGQIVIYTGLRETDAGKLEDFLD